MTPHDPTKKLVFFTFSKTVLRTILKNWNQTSLRNANPIDMTGKWKKKQTNSRLKERVRN